MKWGSLPPANLARTRGSESALFYVRAYISRRVARTAKISSAAAIHEIILLLLVPKNKKRVKKEEAQRRIKGVRHWYVDAAIAYLPADKVYLAAVSVCLTQQKRYRVVSLA